MARPKKVGLDYFPMDVDFLQDPKVIATVQRFGGKSIAVIISIFSIIYKDKGYYVEFDEDDKGGKNILPFIIARDTNLDDNMVRLIVKFLLERSMFDNTLFKSDKILTSRRIQLTYQTGKTKATEANPVIVNEKYWLLNSTETKGFIKFAQNNCLPENHSCLPENHGKLSDNTTKESKVKESKNNLCTEPQDCCSIQQNPVITLTLNDKSEFGIFQSDITQFSELYPNVDILTQLRNMKGWLMGNPTKRKTARGIKKFIHNWLAKEQDKGCKNFSSRQPAYSDSKESLSQIDKRRKELGL